MSNKVFDFWDRINQLLEWEENFSISFISSENEDLKNEFYEFLAQKFNNVIVFDKESLNLSREQLVDLRDSINNKTTVIVNTNGIPDHLVQNLAKHYHFFHDMDLRQNNVKVFFIAGNSNQQYRTLVNNFNNEWHLRSISFMDLDEPYVLQKELDILENEVKESSKHKQNKI